MVLELKEAEKRFKIKKWGFVEEDQPQMFCSKVILKQIDTAGLPWYSISQEADLDIRAWLIEQDVWGCKIVQALMPDKEELLGDTRSVTVQEHKWYRSVIGMMCYYSVCQVQTRWDIAFEGNRAVQFLESPTQGALAAARRIIAYLVDTWDKKWWLPKVQGNTWDLYCDSDHAGDRDTGLHSLQIKNWVVFLLNGMPVHRRSNKQPQTSMSSAVAEICALSEASLSKDARPRLLILEELGYREIWPPVIQVDNAAAMSFQQATKASTKLKGVYNLRDKQVQELRGDIKTVTKQVGTAVNISDVLTTCLSSVTRDALFVQVGR